MLEINLIIDIITLIFVIIIFIIVVIILVSGKKENTNVGKPVTGNALKSSADPRILPIMTNIIPNPISIGVNNPNTFNIDIPKIVTLTIEGNNFGDNPNSIKIYISGPTSNIGF